MSTTTSEFVDYFQLLGLSSSATNEEIEARIREEMRLWVKRTEAPDMAMRQEAERRVKHLTEAKKVLLEPAARQAYEAELRSRPAPAPAAAPTAPAGDEDMVKAAYDYLANGDPLSAVYVASRATERQPGVAEAWAVLAEGKLATGRTDDALYEYRKAIDLKPNEAPYYFGLGGVYERRGEWPSAMQQYEMAARIDPPNVTYRVAIAGVHLQTDNAQKAVDILYQASTQHPDNDVVQYYLAIAYHDAAIQSWTPLRDGNRVITTAQQATFTQDMVNRAQSLRMTDSDMQQALVRMGTQVRYAIDKHWGYTVGDTIKWGAVLGVLMIIFFAVSPGVGVLVLAGIGLWIYLGMQPGWKINAKHARDFQAPTAMR